MIFGKFYSSNFKQIKFIYYVISIYQFIKFKDCFVWNDLKDKESIIISLEKKIIIGIGPICI